MRLLVTGANGFIGRPLSDRLSGDGHKVVRIVRRASSRDEISVAGIDKQTDWRQALAECRVVVHLAARVHMLREKSDDPLAEYRRVNVEGTLNLARQAVEMGVRRLVFISSIGVNGNHTHGTPFTETDVPQPHNDYAVSKHEAELALTDLASRTDLEVVIIRPPLVYGPGAKGNLLSLSHVVRRGVPLPLGAVENRRSLVALENLIDFVVLCTDLERSPKAANQVFLISDGEDVSTPDLLRRMARAYGTKARLIPIPVGWVRTAAWAVGRLSQANQLIGSLVIDSTKARQLLGWRPVATMEQQLQKMAQDA